MSDKRYSKVEEEIIQILNQMDDEPAREPPSNVVQFRSRPKPKRELPGKPQLQSSSVLQRARKYSAGSWVGVGIVAAIVAWQLARFVPALGLFGMVVSLGAFLAALFVWRAGSVPGIPQASGGTKRWRGRDIDLTPQKPPSSGPRSRKWGNRFRGPKF